ncbi:MetQ/NlpA family ABC transporter substrate-binding protein [Propionibacterium australiense]|uniref:Lipoprotein n=1 Tax=Propionibacterium australiense TaxID=119981 RepID=A0A383S9B3_9ACTN|nr:MetQ/NlpA family ABC transporter substrate-binding protein [Propionibacterium australiense]RLP06651.1 MetQ/NlpA family ABC transporter substrate-binding protein [Propionibacterium australiense]RLP06710.1 MetQ/NlpA family ABC transporter substrate-binding protein [Propionibacterium australiense]SYZ34311.1 NLPA lipoprotein [Propionibacterium australiense]VEH92152.1 D-methionine-binding lipoprotein metQ precursor [Propionibacterium australiense]
MKLKLVAAALAAVLSVGLAGCSGSSSGEEKTTVKLGVYGDNNEPWETAAANLEENENIKVELVRFSDYVQPNQALSDGSVDLNSFQTQIYLETYNTEHGTDLTSIGYTIIEPMGLYSSKYDDLGSLPDGATVTIPNDVSNGGRALKLLEKAGLITVDPAAGVTGTKEDITSNPKNLKITELDAAQTARSLSDSDLAAINADIAVDAGLVPSQDALQREEVGEESAPYYNVIAARAGDTGNETYKKVVEYFQTDEVAQTIADAYKGSQFPVWEGAPSIAPSAAQSTPA